MNLYGWITTLTAVLLLSSGCATTEEALGPVSEKASTPPPVMEETAIETPEKTKMEEKPVVDVAVGEKIYIKACIACHAMGVFGSPRLGDQQAWKPLIAKGFDTLFENAVNGFQGKRAYMPARGGHEDLTDEEVRAAVHYMVEKSR